MSNSSLHVGQPNLGDLNVFYKLVAEIMERRWLTNNGEVVQEFEKRLCDYLGVKHCIPVCNGTVGLQIVYQGLELQGDVITTPYTFVATPHSLCWEHLQPVFVDIDPATHNLDPKAVEAAITPETSAILGVHVWGRPCAPEALQEIADHHGIPLIFDAAHAFGCAHNGRMIGNFGNCEVFSFHATKFFNTFEGGAIATNDDELASRIRLLKNFGFSGMDNVIFLGTNGKLSEVHAAMGLACFEVIDELLSNNRRNYLQYREHLTKLSGVRFLDYDDVEKCNYQYVAIEIDKRKFPVDRDTLLSHLHDSGIIARRYFYPGCHRMEPYATQYPDLRNTLQITNDLCSKVLILPAGASLEPEDINRVCKKIESFSRS